MATITRSITLDAPPEDVWTALCDFAGIHEGAARGFVTALTVEGDTRIITFANGLVTRERLVTRDDDARRIAYSAQSERLEHHNSSQQVFPDGAYESRIVWITDVLPDVIAERIAGMMDQGIEAMKRNLQPAAAKT